MTEEPKSKYELIEELLQSIAYTDDERVKELAEANSKLIERNQELELWFKNNEKKVKESEQWRDKYETVVNTPEIKADTEAAFNRGHYMARQKMAAWLMDTARSIMNEEEPKSE